MTSCCPEEKDPVTAPLCSCHEMPSAGLKPDFPILGQDAAPCCGGQAPEPGSPDEKPGYRIWGFVADFMQTPAGMVPRVFSRLDRDDRIGTVLARLGIGRDSYRIAPGIYGVGSPDAGSPVMVTANYKLPFDCPALFARRHRRLDSGAGHPQHQCLVRSRQGNLFHRGGGRTGQRNGSREKSSPIGTWFFPSFQPPASLHVR